MNDDLLAMDRGPSISSAASFRADGGLGAGHVLGSASACLHAGGCRRIGRPFESWLAW